MGSSENEDNYSRKKSKKHKEKKKHRQHKSKKSKHRSSNSSDSDSSNNIEWVEKPSDKETSIEKQMHQRDEWMNLDLDFSTISKKDIKPEKKSQEDNKNKFILDNPGQTERELNPYWKDGGAGLPKEFDDTSVKLATSSVGDQGLDWLKRALKRAEEQAKDEHRSLESVAAERWGSLDKLLNLIKEAEEKCGRKWQYRKKERTSDDYHSKYRERTSKDNYKSKFQFLKPTEDSFHNTNVKNYPSSSKRNWQKKSEDKKEESSSLNEPMESKSSTSDQIYQKNLKESMPRSSNLTVSTDESTSHFLTDKEMNELGAKIVKAEIMGDLDLLNKLKQKMELARSARISGHKNIEKMEIKREKTPENVILSRTDNRGFSRPIQSQYTEEISQKRKKRKVSTHEEGKRVRYFPDDDKHSLQDMFIQEKMTTIDDHLEQFVNLAGKTRPEHDYDADDSFAEKMSTKEKPGKSETRERDRAIAEHRRMARTLDGCLKCLENSLKHLVVSIGQKVYLSVPSFQSLTQGHCLILPIHHVTCSTQLDEDVWDEIQIYKKGLIKMFSSKDMDVVFFETALNLGRFPHMAIECVPLSKDDGALAPIYFKKAILECEKEWSINKKLVELDRIKHLRRSIPKGLPYFAVTFGLESGFAHVVEDEKDFPNNFAQEILGGMLDLDHRIWRKNKKENFDTQRSKMLQFSKEFALFNLQKK